MTITEDNYRAALRAQYEAWAGVSPESESPIPKAGSGRDYFRFASQNKSAIGVYNTDRRENEAFVAFARHFRQQGIPVPKIYAADLDQHIYLQEDLGNTSLFQHLQQTRKGNEIPADVQEYYAQSLQQLAKLQIKGREGLDTTLCYPRQAFDHQSIQWDLNYFKYYWLKLGKVGFDEQYLEDDFQQLAQLLLEADADYFMFRDFQARNIMVRDKEVYFIDFQGGRLGALQYDVVSLLWQARADLPHELREQLLDQYLTYVSAYIPVDKAQFRKHYYLFVYARVLQVLGAYGYRGIFEGKPHFLMSIPYALKNLEWLLENAPLPDSFKHLPRYLAAVAQDDSWKKRVPRPVPGAPLTVRITSFSYKSGIPEDTSGHGGGFVFDCRAIHNPGRYQPYKTQTGRDQPVKDFLEEKSEIGFFLQHVYAVVGNAVQTYLDRGFEHLSVHFGCTGGQHRSVYSADALAKYLQENYQVAVDLTHIQQEKKGWINE